MESLADFLGVKNRDLPDHQPPLDSEEDLAVLETLTGKQFADAILNSRIFRRYIINGLRLGTIPPSLVTRFFDYATGWGKPVDRVEHTGKDGAPIETVTQVRRVIVKRTVIDEDDEITQPRAVTH